MLWNVARSVRVSPEKSWEVSKEGRCRAYKRLCGLWLIRFIVISLGNSKSGDEYNLTFYLVQMSPLYIAQ